MPPQMRVPIIDGCVWGRIPGEREGSEMKKIRLLSFCVLAGLLMTGCHKPVLKSSFTVGADIRQNEITEFYYTYENINFNAFYQRYRFYTEGGKYWFYHETRQREND